MASARTETVLQSRRHARASGLHYVSDAEPGIQRRRHGSGFVYLGSGSRPITAPRTLRRIRSLAIPPAYDEVWICADERGHLQATGRDARGRKQYRYHPAWRSARDDGKFSRMAQFGARLPQLRRRLKSDLALPGMPRNKVLAVVIALLDETLIRVGNEEYVRSNRSYGLTTLRDQHVKFLHDGRAYFCFRSKGGRMHEAVLDDRRLARLVKRCQQLRGQRLFQYVDENGRRQPVGSGDVNDYLREVMGTVEGAGFTAKDFRTWGATVRAIAYLARRNPGEASSERAFGRCMKETAECVAEALGNTAAVCRKSYINPLVFQAWRNGALRSMIPGGAVTPGKMEKFALRLLRTRRK